MLILILSSLPQQKQTCKAGGLCFDLIKIKLKSLRAFKVEQRFLNLKDHNICDVSTTNSSDYFPEIK